MIDPIFSEKLDKYSKIVEDLKSFVEKSNFKEKLRELESISNSQELWDNPEEATKIRKEKSLREKLYSSITKAIDDFNALKELLTMSISDGNKNDIDDCVKSLNAIFDTLDKIEIRRLLSDENDKNNAFLEINSGAGGTESQDWAQMLLRMYSRWAENENFKAELVEHNSGETAGIKSATIFIKGDYAYGLAKTEIGVHRLVRISPFDSQNRRHTSFASVFVYPEIDTEIDIQINPEDLKIDTFRASGAGGQHVNTTDSAVRITHIPTKTVVQCQNQRSQHKNKEEALKMLKAKLYEMESSKLDSEKQAVQESKTSNSWGHQIRSYVLHPYKMIKDLRTGLESSNVDKILNGEITQFIQAELNRRAK